MPGTSKIMRALTTKEAMDPFLKQVGNAASLIASERAQELWDEVFKNKKWQLDGAEGNATFFAEPSHHRITATYAGVACVWLLAYVAYHAFDIGARAIAAEKAKGHLAKTDINVRAEWNKVHLDAYVGYARRLLKHDEPWPDDLERPDANATFNSVAGRINNAFFGATAWIVLHEIAHVHHADETLIPFGHRLRQEFKADDFATHWIFLKAGQGKKREFRILMVSIALLYLFLVERELGQDPHHPPAIVRFTEASHHFGGGNRSTGLFGAYLIFKSVLDASTARSQEFQTPKQAFEWMQTRLAELFPR